MTHLIRLTIIATIALILYLVITHNNERTRVYLIHSYNTDLSWVKEIDSAFQRTMGASSVDVRTHYMDLRNHPSCNFYRTRAKDVELALQSWKPDIIVLVDDLAQQLVGANYLRADTKNNKTLKKDLYLNLSKKLASLCPDTHKNEVAFFGLGSKITTTWHPKIVFAGVNGGVEDYGYNQADNVKGIFENKNYEAIVETLTELKDASIYKDLPPKLVILNENSATVRAETEAYFNQDTFAPFELLANFLVPNLEAWKAAVDYANAENAIILTANYSNIKNGLHKEPAESLIRWTVDNAEGPVLGAGTDFVKHGGMITLAIAGSEQGRVAATLANEWIQTLATQTNNNLAQNNTVDINNYRRAKQYIIGLDYRLAKFKDIKLPLIYEAFSRETNNFRDVISVDYTTVEQ